MNKIGMFFGSFDPIHKGHVHIASTIKQMMELDKVVFLPLFDAPHKPGLTASNEQRIQMCEMAVLNQKWLEVSDVELKRQSKGYSIEMVDLVIESYPDNDMYYIVGSDVFMSILSWVSLPDLIKKVKFAVALRNHSILPKVNEIKRHLEALGGQVYICEFDIMKCSSTHIKELILQGLSIDHCVDNNVVNYIEANHIYKNTEF